MTIADLTERESAEGDFPAELAGLYEVISLIGRGSSSRVYRVRDRESGRHCAAKIVSAPSACAAGKSAGLLEWEILSQLRHPAIVPVRAYHVLGDGCDCLVMDYLEGGTIAEQIRLRGRIPWKEAVQMLQAPVSALGYLHEHGYLHRDLKPANLLRSARGDVLLGDFGLAVDEQSQLVRRGERAGTVPYMSPEQLRGEAHLLDGRCDLWSIGCILYEMVTGRRPFPGSTASEIAEQIANRPVRPPRQLQLDLPEPVEAIILRCLDRDPTRRMSTAADVLQAFRDIATSQYRNAKLMTRRAVLLGGSVALTVGMLTFSRRSLDQHRRVSEETPTGVVPRPEDSSLLVKSFRSFLYREQSGQAEFLGEIREGIPSPRIGDGIRVEAQLSDPAYSYLIAFNPDGRIQLCHPVSGGDTPPLKQTIIFPEDPSDAYFLTDGTGQQAFSLLSSRSPLAPYEKWMAGLDHTIEWRPGMERGYAYVDSTVGRTPVSPSELQRGEVRQIAGMSELRSLNQSLQRATAGSVVVTVAFVVAES